MDHRDGFIGTRIRHEHGGKLFEEVVWRGGAGDWNEEVRCACILSATFIEPSDMCNRTIAKERTFVTAFRIMLSQR